MKRRRIGIYIMLEGVGAQFVRSRDFLPEFEYRAGLRSVLGGCVAARASLLTGRLPREHGYGVAHPRRRGESVFAAARKYAWLPGFVADRSPVREQIREQIRVAGQVTTAVEHCPVRLLPEFDFVDASQFFELGGMDGSRSIFDTLPSRGLNFRIYGEGESEHRNLVAMEEDISRGDVDFLFINLASLGQLFAAVGSEHAQVRERLQWIESWIRRLNEAADRVAEVAELFVFSDHGTSDVHGAVDLVTSVEREFGRNGRHYLAFYDLTMARFWCDDADLRSDLVEFLSERTEGRRIPSEEQALLGWDLEDHSQGDEVFLLNEGLQLVPSYLTTEMRAGLDAYHPDALGSDAIVLGLWSPSQELRHVTDLHSLMSTTVNRLSEE